MKINISEAAKLVGISRQHLHNKYIKQGLVPLHKDEGKHPLIDTEELKAVFPHMKPMEEVSTTDQGRVLELTLKVSTLETELAAVRQQLTACHERERWFQATVDKLTDTLKEQARG